MDSHPLQSFRAGKRTVVSICSSASVGVKRATVILLFQRQAEAVGGTCAVYTLIRMMCQQCMKQCDGSVREDPLFWRQDQDGDRQRTGGHNRPGSPFWLLLGWG